MMKVRLAVLVVMAALVSGCSKQETRPPEVVQPPPVAKAEPTETPEQKAAREAKDKEEYRQREERRRYDDIQSIRMAFLPEKYPESFRSVQSNWKAELRGENRPLFGSACQDFLNWDALYYASQKITAENYGDSKPVTWEEAGIPENQGKAKLRAAGIGVGKQFLGILQMPIEERVLAERCSTGGEGAGFKFTSTSDLARNVEEILDGLQAKPEDLGINTQKWRGIILADYRQRFERLLRTNQEDAMYEYAREAFEGWHFTLEELGLTPEQIQNYKSHYVRSER